MTEIDEDTIQPGSEVVMHYCITLEDGTIADQTSGDDSLSFNMGDGTLVEGLEHAIYGLRAGEHQSIIIGPEHAFGYSDESNIHEMSRTEFPAEMPLEAGTIIAFDTPSGEEVPGMIREVEGDVVRVDFNHPLAGHTITFDVNILSVAPPDTALAE